MNFRQWISTLGIIYLTASCLGAFVLIIMALQADTHGLFFIGLGVLFQGFIIHAICSALEKIIDKQSIIFDYLKNHLPDNIVTKQ
jgi:hypothetical protein